MKRLDLGIIATALVTLMIVTGCGSTYAPTVGSGEVSDETLSKNTVGVGLFTFLDVQNHYWNNPNTAKDSK